MNIWGITDQGVVRQQNQDVFHIETCGDMTLGLVCDGMGGARAGNVASQMAVDQFLTSVKRLKLERWREDPEALLNRAAREANEVVYEKATTDPDCAGMGTTMVAVLVIDQLAYLLNIGDSRGYLVSQGRVEKITRDHSVVERLLLSGQITEEEARQHPQKNLITRALGVEPRVDADFYRQYLSPGDYLLLCSDGLSNVVTEEEMLHQVSQEGEDSSCCQRLLDIAISKGAPDNVTVVLLQM